MNRLEKVVNDQADDEGLWFIARTAPEAYLQQELRRLHAAIEAFFAAPGTAIADDPPDASRPLFPASVSPAEDRL